MFKYSKSTNSIKEVATIIKPEKYDNWDAKSEWFKNFDYNSTQQLLFMEYKNHLASLKEHLCSESCKEVWEDGIILGDLEFYFTYHTDYPIANPKVANHTPVTDTQDELMRLVNKIIEMGHELLHELKTKKP